MSTAPTSNGVFVVIPPSNASGLCPPPAILPTSMCQPPEIMQFEEPPLTSQTPRATQAPDLQPVETFLTGEPKALGDVGRGYLAVLTIFTILEFFIAVIATHFACQATRVQANTPVIFLPNAFSTDFDIPSPTASPPPAYDNVAYVPKESSE